MKGSILAGSLYLIAAGILMQAALAGMFIAGASGARLAHVIVGAVLPYLGIVPTVSAWRQTGVGGADRRLAVGVTMLLGGLWLQEALGHMPFPITTVLHVPLGVVLFASSAWLGSLARAR